MQDSDKSKEELIEELASLRQKFTQLQTFKKALRFKRI